MSILGNRYTHCLCGMSECGRLSEGFAPFDPVRAGFVLLPPTQLDLDLGKEEFALHLRDAYLEELMVREKDLVPERDYYVAVHHFHPKLLKKAKLMDSESNNIYHVPRNLSKLSADKLRYRVHAKVPGTTDRYFCVPDYLKASSDLRSLLRRKGPSRTGNLGDLPVNESMGQGYMEVRYFQNEEESSVESTLTYQTAKTNENIPRFGNLAQREEPFDSLALCENILLKVEENVPDNCIEDFNESKTENPNEANTVNKLDMSIRALQPITEAEEVDESPRTLPDKQISLRELICSRDAHATEEEFEISMNMVDTKLFPSDGVASRRLSMSSQVPEESLSLAHVTPEKILSADGAASRRVSLSSSVPETSMSFSHIISENEKQKRMSRQLSQSSSAPEESISLAEVAGESSTLLSDSNRQGSASSGHSVVSGRCEVKFNESDIKSQASLRKAQNASENSLSSSKINSNQSFLSEGSISIGLSGAVTEEAKTKPAEESRASISQASEQSIQHCDLFVSTSDSGVKSLGTGMKSQEQDCVDRGDVVERVAEDAIPEESSSCKNDTGNNEVFEEKLPGGSSPLSRDSNSNPGSEANATSAEHIVYNLIEKKIPITISSAGASMLVKDCSVEENRRIVFERELNTVQKQWETLSQFMKGAQEEMIDVLANAHRSLQTAFSYKNAISGIIEELHADDDRRDIEDLTQSLVNNPASTPLDYILKTYACLLQRIEEPLEAFEEAFENLKVIGEECDAQIVSLQHMGENACAEMRKAEAHCQESFRRYFDSARYCHDDTWWLESQYRLSIERQIRLWDARSEAMERVVEDFSEVEAMRRSQIQHAISDMIRARAEFFISVQKTFAPFANLISTQRKEYDEVEKWVREDIVVNALGNEKGEDAKLNLHRCIQINFNEAKCILEDCDMETSGLLVHVEPVEIMAGGVLWRQMLSSKTVDEFLHLTPDEPGRTKHDRPDFSLSLYKCEVKSLAGRALLKSKVQTTRKLSLKCATGEKTERWVKLHHVVAPNNAKASGKNGSGGGLRNDEDIAKKRELLLN